MIPRTDGSRAEKLFASLNPATAAMLREAIVEAIASAATLATESAGMAAPDRQDAILTAAESNVASIEMTALDVAAAVLSQHAAQHPKGPGVGAVIAAGALGAAASGVSIGKVRGGLYRAGSVLGDVEAVGSGNPAKIVRRVEHPV